jgi:hypothetical protein
MAGAIGTPGAVNETCFPYELTSIPVKFEDITLTGNLVFPINATAPTQVVKQVDFSSAPFTYFGTSYSTWSVSTDGWIAPQVITGVQNLNRTAPKYGATLVGPIAVFWGALYTPPNSGIFYQRMPGAGGRPGYWVIQWQHSYDLNDLYTPPYGKDDMNFEAKLFDDGVIEFHFGTMVSGNPGNFATGLSKTSWIESPREDRALPIGINSKFMTSAVAWRFTPGTW